jgi:hypothetical protein
MVVYIGSRGKECGSRASAWRLMPSSVRVTSQVPIIRSSSETSNRAIIPVKISAGGGLPPGGHFWKK